MRYVLTLLLALAAFGCADEPDTTTDTDTQATAGAAAPDVGVTAPALTACYAAKSKIKAKYGCVSGWVEGANQLYNTSGTCPDNKDYYIFKTPGQPPANQAVRFEVDWRTHSTNPPDVGLQFRHYQQCNCANDPCFKCDSNGNPI